MINLYIQGESLYSAITYGEPYATIEDAQEGVEGIKAEFEVVMCDELPLDEARACMDLDGRFVAAWRMRAQGAGEYDTVAIVVEP